MSEFKPCPFEHIKKDLGHRPYIQQNSTALPWVQCTCGAAGPIMATEAQAITAWNHRTPDNSALVRELVDALGEAEAIAEDHIKVLEQAKWTRGQAQEITMTRAMLENIQKALTKASEAGF